MQPNRSTFQKAAALVILASVIQAMSCWMQWDGSTFGPKGSGTQAIAALFGPQTLPAFIAIKLDYVVRVIILVILSVLTLGSLMPEPTRRYGARGYSRSRVVEAEEVE